MSWYTVTRVCFIAAVAWAASLTRAFHPLAIVDIGVGASLGVLIVFIESRLRSAEVTDLLGALIGGAIGLGLSKTIGAALFWADTSDNRIVFLHSFILLVFPYLGLVMGARKGEWLAPQRIVNLFRNTGPLKRYRILDTSVIIDGRIADITQTGFLEGPLLVPRSVLGELQRIADASDQIRRNRGRRGLDILNRMQKDMQAVQVQIYDEGDDNPGGQVDAQLVRMAKKLGAWIVTNDYNLNKVAELQGVRVLNVNELANAIKPVMIPGEELTVHLIKDGKEAGQGVGYLDDGTMIVVEGGKRHIGETLDAVVTSVLQTVAGRMIFARPKVLEKDGAAR